MYTGTMTLNCCHRDEWRYHNDGMNRPLLQQYSNTALQQCSNAAKQQCNAAARQYSRRCGSPSCHPRLAQPWPCGFQNQPSGPC